VFENTLITNETQTEIIALVVLVFVVGMLLGLLKYVRAGLRSRSYPEGGSLIRVGPHFFSHYVVAITTTKT